MSIKALAQGELHAATNLSVFTGGVVRPVKAVRVMQGGALRVALNAGTSGGAAGFTASGPEAVEGEAYGVKPTRVFSDVAYVTPSGGTAPYRYAWTINNSAIRIESPGMSGTNFSTMLTAGSDLGMAQCTVTDALGATATVSIFVTLTLQRDF